MGRASGQSCWWVGVPAAVVTGTRHLLQDQDLSLRSAGATAGLGSQPARFCLRLSSRVGALGTLWIHRGQGLCHSPGPPTLEPSEGHGGQDRVCCPHWPRICLRQRHETAQDLRAARKPCWKPLLLSSGSQELIDGGSMTVSPFDVGAKARGVRLSPALVCFGKYVVKSKCR